MAANVGGERIAILGWGSLLWDAAADRKFDSHHGGWEFDGPVLKLEFARKSDSRGGALTLVVDVDHGVPCTVAYSFSDRKDPADAVEDLRNREGTISERIALLRCNEFSGCMPDETVDAVAAWAHRKRVDAVVWTALRGSFDRVATEKFVGCALDYLRGLTVDSQLRAAEYVRNAPAFVRTPLRDAIEQEWWYRSAGAMGER